MGDAEAIADPLAAPSVAAVAPIIQSNAIVTYGGEKTTTTISGVTAEYSFVRNMELAEGEFINAEQINDACRLWFWALKRQMPSSAIMMVSPVKRFASKDNPSG